MTSLTHRNGAAERDLVAFAYDVFPCQCDHSVQSVKCLQGKQFRVILIG